MIEPLNINDSDKEKQDYSKYIVDNKTIDKELTDFLDGKIEQGFKVGIDVLDNHFVSKKNEMTLLTGKKGSGKLQPFTAKILTPKGWSTIGQVGVGDKIICPVSGFPVKIKGEYFGENLDIYKITFRDGSSTECCNDHLWKVQTSKDKTNNKSRVIDVNEILKNGVRTKKGFRYSVPITKPVNFNKKKITLDPYFLGLMLGDGYLPVKRQVTLTSHSNEAVELFSKIKNKVPSDVVYRLDKQYDNCNARRICFYSKIKPYFKELGLLGQKSRTKFIPKNYLYNTLKIRWSLFQGLMDADGSCSISKCKKRLSYSTMSTQLKDDVVELVKSLGGTAFATYETREKYNDGVCWKINIRINKNPFTYSRNKDLFDKVSFKNSMTMSITSIEYIGKKDGKCLMLNSKDHLYITDDYIVTHNTTINQSIQVMQSICNGLIWVVAFQENSEWSCKLNYLQFILCDFVNNVRKNNPSKYQSAKKFIEDHFIFINVDDIKTATEVTKYLIEEKGIDIHGLFLDPINSFRNGWQDTGNSYSDGVYTAREVLLFCKHYCSVYISQHPNMFGQRQEGAVSSNQGEGGWWFNKTHNAVVNHREKGTNNNEFIVENIRNKHTGGSETETENPVVIEWSPTKINICYKDQSIRHNNVIQEMIYKHRPFIYDGMKEEQKNFEKPIINTILNGSLKDAFG